jgi:hypothetical protein
MKKTLQDQYLLIKEGKGHKGVFLTEAKRQFPNIVRNAATFEEATASLITKNIISENVVGLTAINSPFEPKKKESYETAFESFLAEAKKKNEDEKVKAEEKKVSKPVEEDLAHNFNYSDDKNPDNMIFDQIMMGYYAEMKDPKNADKTMQELKDIVFKNLTKDPIHYTKDGQFGVKDLGYVTDHPGLGEPKEAKGKYKSSGYGDLKEGVEKFVSDVKDAVTGKKDSKFTPEEIKAKLKQKREAELKRRKEAGESLEELAIRKVVQEMIDAELNEMVQPSNIEPLRESVEKDLADINKEAEHEVLQAKLDKIDALIDHRRSKLSKLDEDEDMKALTDKKKVKELEKDIKKLEVARKKVEKMMSKFKGKKAASKEVIDEVEDDEELPLETPAEASAEYLQYKEDAENRYDAGESIDSILDNYNNISLDMKNMLRDDLEGKMDGMDY